MITFPLLTPSVTNPFGWNLVLIYNSSSEPIHVRSMIQVTLACKHDFFTGWLLPRGIEQLWMFFLQSAQFWLILTWCDSHCQGTKWLPWLVKIRIGMLWCNAGRGHAPCWLMATQTKWDPWSCVCFTCGWDDVCSGPGNYCGLNLDDRSRMKTQPLSSVISLSSVAHLFVVSWQPP